MLLKALLLGESGVGKTCLLLRFQEDRFHPALVSTAGVDFSTKYLNMGGKRVKCQCWDTAGQERFHKITRAYFKGSDGIILVYDVTDQRSFDRLHYWAENLEKHADDDVFKVLVSNKSDLLKSHRKISAADGKKFADEHSMSFFETSAKSGNGVFEAFMHLFECALERSQPKTADPPTRRRTKKDKKRCTLT